MDATLPYIEWQHTAEGETFLQQLYNTKATGRKLFGILEKPFSDINVEEVCYKLVFIGKNGTWKTTAISRLSGVPSSSYFETLGIRITDIYWPIKVWGKIILFKLQCWDAGNNSLKKYNHIPLSCIDKADFFVFIFSFSDGSSFAELPQLINKFINNNENHPGCIIIGIRDTLKSEVTKSSVKDFEQKYNVQVLSIQIIPYSAPNETIKIAPILNAICEQLWMRDQQYILKQGLNV